MQMSRTLVALACVSMAAASRKSDLVQTLLNERTNSAYSTLKTVNVNNVEGGSAVIYKRDGSDGWGIYRTEVTMTCSFTALQDFVTRVDGSLSDTQLLSPSVIEASKVADNVEEGSIFYRREEMPVFFLSDRDGYSYGVTDAVVTTPEGVVTEFVAASHNYVSSAYPEKRRVVRSVLLLNGFILKQVSSTQVRVTRVQGVDPKGNIPSFLIDSFIDDFATKIGEIQKRVC